MAPVNRVFAAQLAGLPVFGPDGESIGKVRDVVAGLRLDQQPPRVLGLVVELATRRRVFVPMLRITSIEPNAVTLSIAQPASSARNTWPTTVVDLDHEPGRVRVRLGEPVPLLADVTPGAVEQLALGPGAPVWVAVKATAIDVSPR